MKKTMKKLLCTLLVVVMCMTSVPLANINAVETNLIPDDAVEFNGHHYKLFDFGITWNEAKKYCEDLGGHLVTITSKEENDFIISMTDKYEFVPHSPAFIGLYEKSNGEWVWVTGETLDGYSNWASKQPDNWNNHNVAGIYLTDGNSGMKKSQWDDIGIADTNTCRFICEWNGESTHMKKFPSGYDFYEDSYGFGNYSDASLSKKYFTNLFRSANAEEIYKAQKKATGLCCGFAYTTAAIYNNFPLVTSIYDKSLTGTYSYANSLRDVKKTSKIDIGDKTITVSDYIKYSYIYQLSEDVMKQRENTKIIYQENKNGIYELYNLVKTATEDDNLCVIIWLQQIGNYGENCHTVLCVGVDDDGILIDDSNLRESNGFNDEISRLRIADDGQWVYEPYGGKYNSYNTFITYALDCHKPYSILLTGDKVLADHRSNDTGNNYIVGCEKLDVGKGVLYCDAVNYELNDFSKTEFLSIGSGENNSEQTGKLYWVNDNEKISITNIENSGEDAEFHFSSGDTIVEAIVSDGSSITFDSDKTMEIDSELNEEYIVSYAYCFEDENYEDKVIRVSISGVAADETIISKQTDDGIEISGISEGTVTLRNNDEIIATEKIEDAIGDIEITYEKDGSSDELEADYHTHSYASEETKSASCTETGTLTYICTCGDTYAETIPTIGHTSSSWITDLAPTCTLEGSKHIECTVCGETLKTEAIAKLPHTYNSVVTEATCEEGGFTTYTCSCGDTYTDGKTPAKGHNYVEGICENCGESKIDNCTHLCHKSGFLGFIWKLVRFIIRLFRVKPVCSCGMSHY